MKNVEGSILKLVSGESLKGIEKLFRVHEVIRVTEDDFFAERYLEHFIS